MRDKGPGRSDMKQEEILQEIERHRQAIADLEASLSEVKRWPVGFYLTFYVVAGMVLGIMGALTSFIFNIVGSLIVAQDPMKILRVLGTFIIGPEALTTQNLNFLMFVLIFHFSVGAVAGAVFQVMVSRYFSDRPLGHKILLSGAFGLALWIISFYGIISWLQPLLVGKAYILEMMPLSVAASTHLVYGLTLGVLQPIWEALFQELRERSRKLARSVEELKALGEVNQAVTSSLDLQTVLTSIVSHAVQLSGTDGGAIYEYDEQSQEFLLRATYEMEDELIEALRTTPVRLGEGALGHAAVTRAPIQIADIKEDTYPGRLRKILAKSEFRALLAVPLLG